MLKNILEVVNNDVHHTRSVCTHWHRRTAICCGGGSIERVTFGHGQAVKSPGMDCEMCTPLLPDEVAACTPRHVDRLVEWIQACFRRGQIMSNGGCLNVCHRVTLGTLLAVNRFICRTESKVWTTQLLFGLC